MKSNEQFERELPGRFLTTACVIIAASHFYNSSGKADWILLATVALAAVPWMGYVFKSIKKDGVEYQDPYRGETTVAVNLNQQPVLPASLFASFSMPEKKILATLWKYQKGFPADSGQRWTFVVGFGSADYIVFSTGFLELLKRNFVGVASNGQICLSDAGMTFCQQNDIEISRWPDVYDRFSN